jgi:hypothetical protein
MVHFKKLATGISVFLIFCTCNGLYAQFMQDTVAMRLARSNISNIYNQNYVAAQRDLAEITRRYPTHPIIWLLKGLTTYWENYPLLHTSPLHVGFEADMHECITLSEKNDNPAYEAEYLLANLCARGMLLMYYDDNDLIMEVTPLTISTYKYIRRSFSFSAGCIDLNYFTGTYNYYREAYPKAYPVYRSLAFLFPHGSVEQGLKQLQNTSGNAIVMKAEAMFLLTSIYLSFENNIRESTFYAHMLNNEYPSNPLYRSTLIRNLLLAKDYDSAEKLLDIAAAENENAFFSAQNSILRGILQEKKYRNNKLAEQYYNNGISTIAVFGKYGNEYASYAYFGLSRISDDNGENHTRKIYRKEALKLSDFKKINFDK